jgi:hypothetical protein
VAGLEGGRHFCASSQDGRVTRMISDNYPKPPSFLILNRLTCKNKETQCILQDANTNIYYDDEHLKIRGKKKQSKKDQIEVNQNLSS